MFRHQLYMPTEEQANKWARTGTMSYRTWRGSRDQAGGEGGGGGAVAGVRRWLGRGARWRGGGGVGRDVL